MKPAAFQYYCPVEVAEVLELLGRFGDEASLLAGGQSLVPMMNFRLARPAVVIDLNRVDGLATVHRSDGQLVVGAMTRQWDVERSAIASTACPMLPDALRYVGHTATRTRGTIGGTVAHADPTAEVPLVAVVLGAEMIVARSDPATRRAVAAEDFFEHHFTTALADDECLLEIHWPEQPAGAGWAFEEFALRHGDFAVVGVAAMVMLDQEGRCLEARLGLSGVGARPIRAGRAEAALIDSTASSACWEEAAAIAADEISPGSDHHASAGYRRRLASELTRRALAVASERARSDAGGAGHG